MITAPFMYQCKRGPLVVSMTGYTLSLRSYWYSTTGSSQRFRPLPLRTGLGPHFIGRLELFLWMCTESLWSV
jgi:hypothetical protein